MIQSAVRPKKTLEALLEDRNEPAEEQPVLVRESANSDARWLIKSKKSYFGYKGFVVVDAEQGFIDPLYVTGANRAECPELSRLLKTINRVRFVPNVA